MIHRDAPLSRADDREWWETADRDGFTALCYAQLPRMATSREQSLVPTNAAGRASPIRSHIEPIAGYVRW